LLENVLHRSPLRDPRRPMEEVRNAVKSLSPRSGSFAKARVERRGLLEWRMTAEGHHEKGAWKYRINNRSFGHYSEREHAITAAIQHIDRMLFETSRLHVE
jgi:hypothetical protein